MGRTVPFYGGAVLEAVTGLATDFSTPALAVYTGNAVCSLRQVVASSSSFHRARAVFDAGQGSTYRIALDGAVDGGEGTATVSLTLTPLPTNSFVSRPTRIAGNYYTSSGLFVGGSVASPQLLWWSWTAPANNGVSSSQVSLTANAVSFPPEIRVWMGDSYQNLTAVPVFHPVNGASSDGAGTNGMTSTALFTAAAGTNYYIRLAGWQQDPSGSDISPRSGHYRFALNNRALALNIRNLVSNSPSSTAPVSFTADARVENLGPVNSNPLRVSVSALSGVSVRGFDDRGEPTDEILLGIWLAGESSCVPTPAGLVSWWRAEGNASDAGGGNHGVLAGGTSFGAGRVGQAFNLDGVDDRIHLPDVISQLPAGTVEMWFKVNNWNLNGSAAGLYLWSGTQGAPDSSAGDFISLGTHPRPLRRRGAHVRDLRGWRFQRLALGQKRVRASGGKVVSRGRHVGTGRAEALCEWDPARHGCIRRPGAQLYQPRLARLFDMAGDFYQWADR